jgi:hypothetical protein
MGKLGSLARLGLPQRLDKRLARAVQSVDLNDQRFYPAIS